MPYRRPPVAFTSSTPLPHFPLHHSTPPQVTAHPSHRCPRRATVRAVLDTSSRTALESYVRSTSSGSDIEVGRMNILLDDSALTVSNVWLLFAARFVDMEAVQTLLNGDADPNVADTEGSTSLMRSVSRGHPQVAKVLLETPGIDVQRKNDWGYDAVRYLESVRNSKPEAYANISALFELHGVSSS